MLTQAELPSFLTLHNQSQPVTLSCAKRRVTEKKKFPSRLFCILSLHDFLTVFTSVEVASNKLQTKEELNLPNNFYSCSQKSGAKKE